MRFSKNNPITLKNLHLATPQQVFNSVVKHLFKQGEKSVSGDFCAYRGSNGLKCAAGFLIADDEYNAELMEENDWNSLVSKQIVPESHWELILRLQECHDGVLNASNLSFKDQIKSKLIACAHSYNLKLPKELVE